MEAELSISEQQSLGVDDTAEQDTTDNPGDPGDLNNPGETHLKRGLNRQTGFDSPQKKKHLGT